MDSHTQTSVSHRGTSHLTKTVIYLGSSREAAVCGPKAFAMCSKKFEPHMYNIQFW